ncbi:MAG: hypothetical protein ABSB32_12125 [Thermodesulfobacteriota bacterium]|jgi:uncharacterized SAM-binding protein YcdF (DUF218 family)
MKKIARKKIIFSIILLGLIGLLFSSYQTILIEAGRYLTPERIGKADVVILEGTELIRGDTVKVGLKLLSSGEARRLVVVYQHSDDEKIFGRPANYNIYLTKELEELGLKKDQIIVLKVPKEHPITLTEARIVLSSLSKSGVKSAILVAEGFHTRRSLWTYRQVGLPVGIEIIPSPYFIKYNNESWWQKMDGVRDFVGESVKFFYYLVRGYIPLKSILVA